MDIQKVSQRVGIPIECFPNHGRAVLERLLAIGWVKGILVDGYLTLPLTPGSPFFKKLPYIRWSWIELDDGFIYDPSLWLATCSTPRVVTVKDTDNSWYTTYRPDYPPLPRAYDRRVDIQFPKLLNKWVIKELGYPEFFTIRSLYWLKQKLDSCPYSEDFLESTDFLFVEGENYVQPIKTVNHGIKRFKPSKQLYKISNYLPALGVSQDPSRAPAKWNSNKNFCGKAPATERRKHREELVRRGHKADLGGDAVDPGHQENH